MMTSVFYKSSVLVCIMAMFLVPVLAQVYPPTSIRTTPGTTVCRGSNVNFQAEGYGTIPAYVRNIWYQDGYGGDAYDNGWDASTAISSPYQTTINNINNGILNLTSTGGDPQISMLSLGSFNPSIYKYVNIRYRVVTPRTATTRMEIFFLNTTYPNADANARVDSDTLISDNIFHTISINMSSAANWTTGGNITGWRLDWSNTTGVTMDIDFIQLGTGKILNDNFFLNNAPTTNTTFYTNWKGPGVNTSSISQSIIVNARPITTFNPQPGATVCANTDVTYPTQSGQTNYVWTVPGTVNTDYTITSGGVETTSNTVTLKWLTAGSKIVKVNYTNSNGCSAFAANQATSSTTVSARPTPTFTAQPGATACASTDVTYTTQSGQTNYVWTVPGTLDTDYTITSGGVGSTDNAVTLKWLTSGSKTVTINYTSSGCPAASATSSTATTVSACTSGFTWTGLAGDNLWNTAGNWSTGTTPLATTDIIISSGTPRLNVDYAVEGSLTISGTGTLTIDPGKTLSISTGGVVDFGGKSVTIKSDVTGTAQLGRIQGTLNRATNVTVERYIPATGRRYRMIAPSVNSTGSIRANWMEGNMNTSGTNVNTVAGYGTQITGPGGNTNGFDMTGSNEASLYLTTNGIAPAYISIANTNGTLNALTGYFLFLRGDRSMNMSMSNTNKPPTPVPLPSSATTLRATGTVVTGTISLTSSLSTAAGGFSIITNPYPAAIDWTAVHAASTNINNYYTYWDPNLGFRGGFTTVSATASTPRSSASKIIQSGQAFFVTTTANGAPSISIQESHKVGNAANNVHGIFKANTIVDDIASTKVKGISPLWENYQPNLQQTTSTIPEFRMSLYYTESSGYKRLTDGAVALFDSQYSSTVDGNDAVDAPNWDENIAIMRNGQNLAIESRAELNDDDTLAISMSGMKSMNYELQFQGSNFGSTLLQPMLIDNYLNTLTPLSLTQSTTVPFTVATATPATFSKDRFKVVFKTSVVLPFTVTKITATKKNETVQVDWEVKTDEDLKSFDVERSADGRSFVKLATVASLGKGITLANYSWVDNNPLVGANYYRIKVIPLSGKEKVSPVANITMDKNKPSMEVYPNPTEGNDFNIKLSNLTKGTYQVIITASNGQQVLVKTIEHPGGTAVRNMVFDNDISKGVYRVQVQGEGLSLLSSIIKN